MSSKQMVLVAGVHEVSGKAAAIQWSAVPEPRSTGSHGESRRSRQAWRRFASTCYYRADVQQKLGGLQDVRHIVFGAYISHEHEKSEVNVAILRNCWRWWGPAHLRCATSPSIRKGSVRGGPRSVQDARA